MSIANKTTSLKKLGDKNYKIMLKNKKQKNEQKYNKLSLSTSLFFYQYKTLSLPNSSAQKIPFNSLSQGTFLTKIKTKGTKNQQRRKK